MDTLHGVTTYTWQECQKRETKLARVTLPRCRPSPLHSHQLKRTGQYFCFDSMREHNRLVEKKKRNKHTHTRIHIHIHTHKDQGKKTPRSAKSGVWSHTSWGWMGWAITNTGKCHVGSAVFILATRLGISCGDIGLHNGLGTRTGHDCDKSKRKSRASWEEKTCVDLLRELKLLAGNN